MAERAGRLLALVFIAPVVLHLVGRGFEGAWLVLLLAAAPSLVAWVAARRGCDAAERDELVWLSVLVGAFATPLLPTILRIDGFETPLVLASGGLAWLAWRGRLTALTAAPRPGRAVRLFLWVFAAWSVGSALRGYFAWRPDGVPWTGELFLSALADPFGYRSLVDPMRPFSQLFLRLETLTFLWAGFELALGALGRGDGARFEGRLLKALVVAVGLGILAALAEFASASVWRGDPSILGTIAAGIGRNPRPLLDHNALGSALVLIAPLLLVGAAMGRGASQGAWRLATLLAALASLGLLVSSRSKSALAGFAVALPLALVFLSFGRGGRARKLALAAVGAGVLGLLAFNLAPASVLEPLAQSRYGNDLLRVVRFEAAKDYLVENRATVWKSARAVGEEHPILGVGLGRLPILLGEHHDPEAEGWFNPRNENAHCQYLQWWSEEGAVGLGLGLFLFLGAILGGLRRQSSLSLVGSASVCGLALNLVVGHALLLSSVALVFAAFVGWLLAGGSMIAGADEAAEAAGQRPRLAPLAAGGAFLVALAPLALDGRRLPLAETTLGCYPWDWLPGTGPKRARAVGPHAAWFQEWKSGKVMKIPVRDVRDPRFEEPVTLDLFVNGERVLTAFELPHHTQEERASDPELPANPLAYLRVTRPEGVEDGDLIELRLDANSYFVGSRVYSTDHRRVALRMWPAFFQ